MLLILALVAIALILSLRTVRSAVPMESLLAIGIVGVLCVLLLQVGRLA